jgi:hypothetical protein
MSPFEYPLRAYVTITGATAAAEIGFPAWPDVADWLTSPSRHRLDHIEAITIVRAEHGPNRKDTAA